ncbi:MAG: DUF1294 domain-containing protein [Halomonadaceae bacterium]|nr:MAG: DUF1294 domain-containing protein [Halomonadaceae bacterium]
MVSCVVVVFFALLTAVTAAGQAPLVLVGAYALVSVTTFVMYGFDKAAAKRGRWRTAETSLHLAEVLGGWPGALVAQRVFRHKTKKQPFQRVFWCAVAVNCAGLAWFLYAGAAAGFRASLGF